MISKGIKYLPLSKIPSTKCRGQQEGLLKTPVHNSSPRLQLPYLLRGKVGLRIMLLLGENNCKHGMGTAACFIHVGSRHCPKYTERRPRDNGQQAPHYRHNNHRQPLQFTDYKTITQNSLHTLYLRVYRVTLHLQRLPLRIIFHTPVVPFGNHRGI